MSSGPITYGRRLDRPWMLAVGARSRSMVLGAHGDLDAAGLAVQRALAEHRRLAMPFEHARTQLLLGKLDYRRGHRAAASAVLSEALATFERLNTPLWAYQARAALAVNGQVEVPAGGQIKVPAPCGNSQVGWGRSFRWWASFMRWDWPSVMTTVAWCRSRSRMLTAVVRSGRNRPHSSNGQCDPMARDRRS